MIKFFYNKKICSDRVARTKNLKGLVPELLDATENFYKYKFVEANLMADSVNLIKFINLLTWARDTLWIKKEDESYRQNALAFYKDKTLKRVDKFLNKYNIEDEPDVINGIEVPSIKDMIHEIEFDYLIGKNPTGFHGDFILDNILIDEKKFTLIDWRQDFNGSIDAGDMNYDLAKLNHNLILSHQILANNLFTIECKEEITCDVHVKKSHLECQDYLLSLIHI